MSNAADKAALDAAVAKVAREVRAAADEKARRVEQARLAQAAAKRR